MSPMQRLIHEPGGDVTEEEISIQIFLHVDLSIYLYMMKMYEIHMCVYMVYAPIYNEI